MHDWWQDNQRPTDEECAQALAEAGEQIDAWGLTMPQVEPLIIHFGLNDFRRIGLIIYSIVNETEAGYCGKFLFLSDGQTCPCHQHKMKHETFYIVQGRVKMVVDDREQTMGPGDVLVMDTGTRHSFTGVGNALLLEVSLPSSGGDNFFDDKRIGKEGVV